MAEKEHLQEDELLKKYDPTTDYRHYTGLAAIIVSTIAVTLSLFHLYTAGFGVLLALKQRAVHLGFIFTLIFLLYPTLKHKKENKLLLTFDMILALASIAISSYIIINYESLVHRAGMYTQLDQFMAILAIIIVLEGTRRALGPELPVISILFLLYAHYGQQMPGMLAHRGYSWSRIASHMYFTTEGIFGIPLGVSATYIFLFLLLGAFAKRTGLGDLFIDLALSLTGRTTGGPAKAAVVSSGLMGSISGSSVANTVTTGSFTIPLMKKVGYNSQFAAAVEAAASTGGQIMPPIMGAAAFIMAEFIGVPYVTIAKAAILPAILYYITVGLMVHFEAKKQGLEGMSDDLIPKFLTVLKTRGHMIAPLIIIFYYLFKGYTPLRAAFLGIIVSYALSFLKKDTRMGLQDLLDTLREGAISALGVAAACAAVGFIVGVTTLTGLGLKFTSLTVALANGNLFMALFFTMVACTILGTGLPTTATYIVLATMAAPALTQLGVPILAAHLFVLYFGVVADLTPPAALAAYAGAGIAGSNPLKTGLTAVRLAIAGFVVPFVFAYSPSLLLINTTAVQVILITGSSIIGVFSLAAAVLGYLNRKTTIIERILLLGSSLGLLIPGWQSDIIGLSLLGIVLYLQFRNKDLPKPAAA
ncbi:MAG: TRAP transporter, 4TM/12TM fusion protein [Halanaerobium sp. 4-GBenrich]|jgi:TRAP transporter 4TM/12TM fusion protein|uniref:TRAP transporter 4TM/12TM fusion protein n=2 Tax=Halanaerobium TaxID=2330 RepID=A0A1G6RFI9_9FIRM|nr:MULTISPECIES: TRAP transporter permease [Halanaerobium]KXS49328.1 MAG: TRAP transporter, 4TM/12TM fusion protein [Halanaerobium sp. T82-1]ODS50804.1 MAG: TRAP transporter, 4TM/12TM fusion protein [Halanaerobium sp. 4-GBenrich]OEG62422.1 MAG: C4-dicarboxylate ABC transporter permease [Halanaerobium sp. MDAL1]PUU89830.1 MAG: TRAP transporter, 4TM/12TM fusion protein [Halanaerobium sp.]PTX16582.1 TRAP transporter 4TM/12TM fusion protein [Halanaerobium congolense]